MNECRFTVLPDRGVLAVAGPDRASFLQGLVSNDTARVSGERAVYAALLTAQGKYLHDFIMVECGEAIWFDAEAARLADLKRRLSMYRLRAAVTLDERPDLAVAAMFGDVTLGLPGDPGATRALGDGAAFVDSARSPRSARGRSLPREHHPPECWPKPARSRQTSPNTIGCVSVARGSDDGNPRPSSSTSRSSLESGVRRAERRRLAQGRCYIGQELTATHQSIAG